MNRNGSYSTCLSLALSGAIAGLSSCGSISLHGGGDSSSNVTASLSIIATSGTPQSQVIDELFGTPLAATVMTADEPAGGMMVTFTAPTTGPTGVFADTRTGATTAITNSSGLATAPLFIANGAAGSYDVTATVAGATLAADFSLTNTAFSTTYVFYLSGQEAAFINYYALLGAVEIDSSGNVIAGVQDYNDAEGVTSPQPIGDKITGGLLKVDSTTGQGTLTLHTNNIKLGTGGVETFAVQFVNSRHALLMRFDGTAAASGGMDLQTLADAPSGGFAFTMAGVDPLYLPVAFGGVFSISGGVTLEKGIVDTNDDGLVVKGVSFGGALSASDSFGRGTIASSLNFNGAPIALNYYIIGPGAIRIIDVDPFDSAIGSAYSQGANATVSTNASVGGSVFALAGIPFLINYGAVGMLFPRNTSFPIANFSGVADDNELSYAFLSLGAPITRNVLHCE